MLLLRAAQTDPPLFPRRIDGFRPDDSSVFRDWKAESLLSASTMTTLCPLRSASS